MTDVPRRADHEGTRPRRMPGRDLFRTRVMLGSRMHAVYGKTEQEAADRRNELVARWKAGLAPLDSRLTVGQWLDEWIRDCERRQLGVRTVQSYRDTVRLYIAPRFPDGTTNAGKFKPRPFLGTIRLAKLDDRDIAALLATATGPRGDLSGTTRRYVYSVLRIALGRAVKAGRIHTNAAERIDPPARSTKPARPLTADEATTLRVVLAGKPNEALILTALTCGLREGELLGLTWPAIDEKAGTLEVRAQLQRGTKLLVDPKRESRRRVDIPATTLAVLKAHHRSQKRTRIGKLDWDPRDFVFTTDEGQPLTNGQPVRIFQAILADAKLPKQRLHDLRHWFATSQIEAGVDLAVVSKLLGHRDIATTSNVYGHLTEGMRRDAAERMERALRRKA